MSSHRLDVSGQRGLSLTMNDPASTAAQTNAKAGDDVRVTLGAFREIRLILLPSARIQRRVYKTKRQVQENGKAVRDPETGEFVYDESESEMIVLVLSGSANVFGRTSFLDPTDESNASYEGTPHTAVYAKRLGEELDFTESGDLAEERTLGDLLGTESPA